MAVPLRRIKLTAGAAAGRLPTPGLAYCINRKNWFPAPMGRVTVVVVVLPGTVVQLTSGAVRLGEACRAQPRPLADQLRITLSPLLVIVNTGRSLAAPKVWKTASVVCATLWLVTARPSRTVAG